MGSYLLNLPSPLIPIPWSKSPLVSRCRHFLIRTSSDTKITRKCPKMGRTCVLSFLELPNSDLEWALAGYAELYDTTLGHIGHSWEREEFDLDFRANKPIGDFNHLAFGAS